MVILSPQQAWDTDSGKETLIMSNHANDTGGIRTVRQLSTMLRIVFFFFFHPVHQKQSHWLFLMRLMPNGFSGNCGPADEKNAKEGGTLLLPFCPVG